MKKETSPLSDSFHVLSSEVIDMIKENKERSELCFLFGGRRGLAPSTVCGDCGTVVACEHCSSPIVLHKNSKGNFFLCHKCGARRSAEERCKKCESWRLVTLGIGVELIEQELKRLFPEQLIFRIDKDTAATMKKGQKIAEAFYNAPGSILIGTEMALQYLEESVDNAAVISLDSLFSIPDFRINEKIASIIMRIRSKTTKRFMLQTRLKEHMIIDKTMQGNLAEVFREEIEDRKRFEYPPFWTLIRISLRGDRAEVRTEMNKMEAFLAPYSVTIFPAFTEVVKGKYTIHGLIRVPKKDWINPDLLHKLRSLPPRFSVNVDPETLL